MKISEMVRTVLELENEEVVPDAGKKESLLNRSFAGIKGGATAAGKAIKKVGDTIGYGTSGTRYGLGATGRGIKMDVGRGLKAGVTAAKATGKLANKHRWKTAAGIGAAGAAGLANNHPLAAIGSGAIPAIIGLGAGVAKLRAMHKKRAAAKAEAKAGE